MVARSKPLSWRDFVDENHHSVVAFKAWLLGLKKKDLEEVQERIEALRQLAAAGEIEEGDDEKLGPTSVDPVIWALKWRFFGLHLRQYHAEPTSHPELLVTLHLHTKPVDTRNAEVWEIVREEQSHEMGHAKLRYVAGVFTEWR